MRAGWDRSNAERVAVAIEVRLFNSLVPFGGAGGARRRLRLPAGSTIADVLARFAIPAQAVHLALQNGRDVTPGLRTPINTGRALDEGDVIALSGPVPYSWGYGALVV